MREIAAHIYAFMDQYLYWMNISHVGIVDIVEIIIVAFLLYHFMVWIKDTRAWVLFKGIAAIIVFLVIAAMFQMNTILWLAGKLASVALIALVIIFQPELRSALERLGRRNYLVSLFGIDLSRNTESRYSEKTINDIVKACYEMGKVKTGAIIVLERDIQLVDVERTGIPVDSLISSQLIINIFEHNTPLHDGAVVVRGDRIVAATCYLPLSDNMALSKELGTRHRAAVGISEVSDSLTLVVSEETGSVSLTMDGIIFRDLDQEALKQKILSAANGDKIEDSKVHKLRRRLKDAKISKNPVE